MFRFRLSTLLWFVACTALAVWLLTLPRRAYWLKYRGETVWAPELDFIERVGGSVLLFVAPFAIAWAWKRFRSVR
jgi:hypothetical protein